MKRIYILIVLSFVLVFISYKALGIHHLKYEEESIKVTVVYHNERYEREIDNYSVVKDVIETLDLGDDVDYQKINLETILSHGDVVNIPIITEQGCISINTATVEELSTLPGIGIKTAEVIIQHRTENQLFQKLEDIMLVKGIGKRKYEVMLDRICL